jgi:hypothetical protein
MWAAMLIRFMHSKECSLGLNNEILVRRSIPLLLSSYPLPDFHIVG